MNTKPRMSSRAVPQQNTSALYIHIPFCEKRCVYCDFYTVAQRAEAIPGYVDALCREIVLRSQEPLWQRQTFSTVFFGGGTPSLLNPEQIRRILTTAADYLTFAEEREITMEANPGTTCEDNLAGYLAAGVDRLSLGVQSFWPDELEQLDRLHSVDAVYTTVRQARDVGFTNLSLDLIFALPGQRPSRWRYNLEQAIALQPTHVSAYNLTIEKGTPLFKLLKAGKVRALREWQERVLYNFTIDFFEDHGFAHYEVSNYALPGFHSRHNTKYWDGSQYLGLGASAHSYDGRRRFWNIDNYVHYGARLRAGELPVVGEEILTPSQKRFETIFLGLRQRRGVDLAAYARAFHSRFAEDYAKPLDKLMAHEPPLVAMEEDRLVLTREGWLLCDAVCGEFL